MIVKKACLYIAGRMSETLEAQFGGEKFALERRDASLLRNRGHSHTRVFISKINAVQVEWKLRILGPIPIPIFGILRSVDDNL